jgi:hypothetical protein
MLRLYVHCVSCLFRRQHLQKRNLQQAANSSQSGDIQKRNLQQVANSSQSGDIQATN